MVAAGVRALLTHGLHIHQPVVLLLAGIGFGVTIPVIFYNLLVEHNIFWWLFTYHRPKKTGGNAPAAAGATVPPGVPPATKQKSTSIEYVYNPPRQANQPNQ
jgi:hypothetical protein